MPISIQFESLSELKDFLSGKNTKSSSNNANRRRNTTPTNTTRTTRGVAKNTLASPKKGPGIKAAPAKNATKATGKLVARKSPVGKAVAVKATRGSKAAIAPAKPGRKPAGAATSKNVTSIASGRKKSVVASAAPARKKNIEKAVVTTRRKSAEVTELKSRSKGRPRSEGSLTAKIHETIQKFVDRKTAFTANEIYHDLAKRDNSVNKQSVITSVLKLMKTSFSPIKVQERPGAGPRPVKVYLP